MLLGKDLSSKLAQLGRVLELMLLFNFSQPLTWPAENPTALLSQLSSVGVTLSTNIAPKTTAPSTTAPPAAITSTIVPPASGEPRTLSTVYETRFLVTVLLSAILVGGWNWMLN